MFVGTNEVRFSLEGSNILNGGLVWWSSVGLFGGVVSISFLDLRVGSVVIDGSKSPNWSLVKSLSGTEE